MFIYHVPMTSQNGKKCLPVTASNFFDAIIEYMCKSFGSERQYDVSCIVLQIAAKCIRNYEEVLNSSQKFPRQRAESCCDELWESEPNTKINYSFLVEIGNHNKVISWLEGNDFGKKVVVLVIRIMNKFLLQIGRETTRVTVQSVLPVLSSPHCLSNMLSVISAEFFCASYFWLLKFLNSEVVKLFLVDKLHVKLCVTIWSSTLDYIQKVIWKIRKICKFNIRIHMKTFDKIHIHYTLF